MLEIMAVLLITGILSAVAIPSGFNFYVRLQMDEAQNTIYSAIRTARANARSSVGSGRSWSVRIDNDGDVPVVFIEDGLPPDPARCRDILSCQEIVLSNLVDVNVNLPFRRLTYNSRGLRVAESCLNDPNPPNPCGPNGTFRVTSPNLQGIERCVAVGDAVIGTVRKGCPS